MKGRSWVAIRDPETGVELGVCSTDEILGFGPVILDGGELGPVVPAIPPDGIARRITGADVGNRHAWLTLEGGAPGGLAHYWEDGVFHAAARVVGWRIVSLARFSDGRLQVQIRNWHRMGNVMIAASAGGRDSE